MSRLPVPGGDDGTWGDILNDYLLVEHEADGTLTRGPTIDGHIADATKHRQINDAGSATTDLWSASKITGDLSGKAATSHTHTASQVTDFSTAVDLVIKQVNLTSGSDGATATANAAAINAAIGSGGVHVIVRGSGTYYINARLYLQSNTWLELDPNLEIRATATMQDYLVVAYQKDQVWVTGGRWDCGSIPEFYTPSLLNNNLTITSATGSGVSPIVCTTATHGFSDGVYINISGGTGNTAINGNFYVKVTGYSATTFALYNDSGLTSATTGNGTYTGSSAHLLHSTPTYAGRNKSENAQTGDVSASDLGSTTKIANSWPGVAIVFAGCTNSFIRDAQIRYAPKYAVWIVGCTNTEARDLYIVNYSDGVHFGGACANCQAINITAFASDNVVALVCTDYTSHDIFKGTMENTTVRNIHCMLNPDDPTYSMGCLDIRLTGKDSILNTVIDNVTGYVGYYDVVNTMNDSVCVAGGKTQTYVNNLVMSNIAAKTLRNTFAISDTDCDNVVLRDSIQDNWDSAKLAQPPYTIGQMGIVSTGGSGSCVANALTVQNVQNYDKTLTATSGWLAFVFGSQCTLNNPRLDNVRLVTNSTAWFVYFTGNITVKNMLVSRCHVDILGGVDTRGFVTDGTALTNPVELAVAASYFACKVLCSISKIRAFWVAGCRFDGLNTPEAFQVRNQYDVTHYIDGSFFMTLSTTLTKSATQSLTNRIFGVAGLSSGTTQSRIWGDGAYGDLDGVSRNGSGVADWTAYQPGDIVNNTKTTILNGAGKYVRSSDSKWVQVGGSRVTVTAASNTSVSIPAGYALDSIYYENTTANAVTGGVKIGTTSGGTEVVVAQTIGANAIGAVTDANILLRYFSSSAAQTLFIQAVTAWNSASVRMTFEIRKIQ